MPYIARLHLYWRLLEPNEVSHLDQCTLYTLFSVCWIGWIVERFKLIWLISPPSARQSRWFGILCTFVHDKNVLHPCTPHVLPVHNSTMYKSTRYAKLQAPCIIVVMCLPQDAEAELRIVLATDGERMADNSLEQTENLACLHKSPEFTVGTRFAGGCVFPTGGPSKLWVILWSFSS